jgi:TolB-like protein/Flp pilus assembly protein TadD
MKTHLIPPDEVRQELQKVLRSSGFAGAGRLGPFLRHLVEAELAGETDRLKESVVGVEVFRRSADYDPRIDPIVRVEARRLRQRLDGYYSGVGALDSVRIDVPKGGYVPAFSRTEQQAKATGHVTWVIAAAVIVAVVVAVWAAVAERETVGNGGGASVAVLPFLNLSQDADDVYFSDGLSEELIDRLANVDGLRVAARSLSFQHRGDGVDVREAGRDLGVETVVEGSVRKSGERLRVTAQLVNVSDGYQLWSRTYERNLRDIFAIQSEIASSIANALKVELKVRGSEPLGPRYTENIEVYNLYLKAGRQFNRTSTEGSMRALQYCEQAIELDREYAPAWALLANIRTMMGYYEEPADGSSWIAAKRAAERAIEIDAGLAEAQAALGFVVGFHEWKWAESEALFERALELNPASGQVHGGYAMAVLTPQGRLVEAFAEYRTALELEPLATVINYSYGYALLASGDCSAAAEQYRKTLELSAQQSDMWWDYGMALGFCGRHEEAEAAIRRSGEVGEGAKWQPGPMDLWAMGREDEGRKGLERLEQRALAENIPAINVARTYAVFGETDKALEWLQRAIDDRENQVQWIKIDPRFRALQQDPRMAQLRRTLGLD